MSLDFPENAVLCLVRHGQTDWNLHNKMQGRDDIEMNEEGIGQVSACAEALAAAGFSFDKIYCSTLSRAVMTAEMIAKSLGLGEPIRDERILEKDFGIYSGMNYFEYGELSKAGKLTSPTLEADSSIDRRVCEFARDAFSGGLKRILAVSHGALIKEISKYASNGDFPLGVRMKNCSLTFFTFRDGRLSLCDFNVGYDELENREKIKALFRQ